MPLGPYADFAECVTAQQNKGKSADAAKRICGAMEQQQQQQQAAATGKVAGFLDPSKSKLYVKAFLLDSSLNLNKWRVTKDSVDKNINSFIGKPLVLTENFDHPTPNDGEPESLNHWLSYQESFRVGTIIDIVTKPNPAFDSTIYYAIIEIQDDNLKQSLKDNTVPIYVSPGIAELVPVSSVANAKARLIDGEFVDEVSNWTGVHLAVVSEPAFGIKKAVISDQCGGDKESCLLQLRKAHVEKFGIGKCGFCTKKALQKYAILRRLAQKTPNKAAANSNQILDTSHKVSQVNNQTGNYRNKMSQLENTGSDPVSPNTVTTIPQQQQQQQNETVVERVEQRGGERPETRAPINVPATPPPPSTFADLMSAYQKLSDENKLLKIKNEELYSVKDTLSERVAALETQSRREAIERIITADVIKDPKQRLERIKYFVSSTIPLDQIEELYKDMKVTLRKASVNNFGVSHIPRVPYISAKEYNKDYQVDEEEQGEMSQLEKELAILEGNF